VFLSVCVRVCVCVCVCVCVTTCVTHKYILHHTLITASNMSDRVLHKEIITLSIAANQSNSAMTKSVCVVHFDIGDETLINSYYYYYYHYYYDYYYAQQPLGYIIRIVN